MKASKNIHILPTPNESRLYYNSQEKAYQLCEFPKYHTDIKSTHNVYITSNEEPKEGDYYIIKGFKSVYKITSTMEILVVKDVAKKIILTTDQDLIADGVQAIDDKFLEWFVKNPSCEEVKTIKVPYFDESGYSHLLIIPKGEPKISIKKEYVDDQDAYGYDVIVKEEPKQETWEERKWLEIFREYTKYKKSNLFTFFDWLEKNYNPPTKK